MEDHGFNGDAHGAYGDHHGGESDIDAMNLRKFFPFQPREMPEPHLTSEKEKQEVRQDQLELKRRVSRVASLQASAEIFRKMNE